MLRSVYIENKGDPSPLVDPARYPDAEAIKAHLFNELIPALITKRRPVRNGSDPLRPRRGWEPSETRRWLAYLAVQLHGERDLRWWQLANLHLVSDVRGLPGPGDGRKRVPSRCSLPPSRGCRWGTGDVAGSLIAVAANPCRSWCQRPPAWCGGFEPERGGEVAGRSGCVLAMLRAIASIACAESPITRPPRGRA